VLTGGPFALALAAELAAGGLAAQVLEARRAPAVPPDEEAGDDVPLEWAGIVRPFPPEEIAALDRELGLEPEQVVS
jgi:hypothetical protein